MTTQLHHKLQAQINRIFPLKYIIINFFFMDKGDIVDICIFTSFTAVFDY